MNRRDEMSGEQKQKDDEFNLKQKHHDDKNKKIRK